MRIPMRRSTASGSPSGQYRRFPRKPARFVAAALAREYGSRGAVVEPYAGPFPSSSKGPGRSWSTSTPRWKNLVDVLITLVDHDVFKVIPPEERTGKKVYDTRGIMARRGIEPDRQLPVDHRNIGRVDLLHADDVVPCVDMVRLAGHPDERSDRK